MSYLAIGEDGAVVSVQHGLHHLGGAGVVDLALRGGGAKDRVKREDLGLSLLVLALASGGGSAVGPPHDDLAQRLVRVRDAVRGGVM